MNFEVKTDSDRKKDRQKGLSVNLIDDYNRSYDNSPTRASFYREISSGGLKSFSQGDPMGQVMGYEAIITRDYLLYTGLIFFGLVMSFGLVFVYITKHEGFWMAFMCILEGFSFYTWLIGYDAKKKLKAEIQHSFLSCLFVLMVVKAVMSILGFYSVLTWEEDEPQEVNTDSAVQSRLKSIDLTIIFSLLQLATAGYVYYKGRKLMDLLVKRKSLIGGDFENSSNDLAVL